MARGLPAVHETHEAIRSHGADVRASPATLDPDSGPDTARQAQCQTLQAPCHARHDAIRHHRGGVMASCAPGLCVGGADTGRPQDPLALARWLKQPKGPERRIHGHRHAGVRLVQAGPTVLLALDAHLAHPEPCTAAA
jgi:hypothetical protein